MVLLSYNVAHREKILFFPFPQLPYQTYQVPLSELKPLHFGEHMSEHFYSLAASFPSSALQLNLQNQPPLTQSSKMTDTVRASTEKRASK